MFNQKKHIPVFNSLGSNYSESYVAVAKKLLLYGSEENALKELEQTLSYYFPDGQFRFFYKGRDAITIALESIKTDNKVIFIQAFSCFAIEDAIIRAGWQPVYIDIENNSLNPSLETIHKAQAKYGVPQALLLQHTLGYGADSKKIKKWCNNHKVVLIDDLAQSFGAIDTDNNIVGSQADMVLGSFGRDKIIDAVSGGFLYIPHRTHLLVRSIQSEECPSISWWQTKKDLLYILVTTFFKNNYPSATSKLVLSLAKAVGIITTPLAAPKQVHRLSSEYAKLALLQLENLEQQLATRREKALFYFEHMLTNTHVIVPISKIDIERGANVRFPIMVKNPTLFIDMCKEKGIFISDRWYRFPVDCSTLECESVYKAGSCSNAERVSAQIVNLPTHQYVTRDHQKLIINILKNLS